MNRTPLFIFGILLSTACAQYDTGAPQEYGEMTTNVPDQSVDGGAYPDYGGSTQPPNYENIETATATAVPLDQQTDIPTSPMPDYGATDFSTPQPSAPAAGGAGAPPVSGSIPSDLGGIPPIHPNKDLVPREIDSQGPDSGATEPAPPAPSGTQKCISLKITKRKYYCRT